MRPLNRLDPTVRCTVLLGTLAVAGCVPSGFVYDLPQDRSYNSGGSYYSAGTPGYYGQPFYYGQPGYYPRVVYDHDHDRDDCRHESHRDRRDDRNERNDRDRRDAPADRPPSPRAPRGVTPKDPAPTARPEVDRSNHCAGGKKCGPSAQTTEGDVPRRRTQTRDDRRLVEQ